MTARGELPPAVGTYAEYEEHPLQQMREWSSGGDVVRVTGDELDRHLLYHPDHVEHVLFENHERLAKHMVGQTSVATKSVGSVYGDQWQAQRSAQQPHFGPEQVRSYTRTFQSVATDFVEKLPTGEPFDVQQALGQLSIRLILRTLAGIPFGEIDESVVASSRAITDWHHAKATEGDVPPEVQARFDEAYAGLQRTIDARIDARPADAEGEDLIATLLALGPDHPADYTDDRIRDEILAKIFSAHRTTSQSWTFTLYRTTGAPAVTRHVREELDSSGGGVPGPDQLDGLAYLERVYEETLRLHPPAPALTRELTGDLTVGGYTLPEGDVVTFPMVVIHRDERWWDNPETFRPARFDDEPAHRFAYFPFGIGPRRCLGEGFALAQAKVVLGALLGSFDFERVTDEIHLRPGTAGVLDPERPFTLIPRPRGE